MAGLGVRAVVQAECGHGSSVHVREEGRSGCRKHWHRRVCRSFLNLLREGHGGAPLGTMPRRETGRPVREVPETCKSRLSGPESGLRARTDVLLHGSAGRTELPRTAASPRFPVTVPARAVTKASTRRAGRRFYGFYCAKRIAFSWGQTPFHDCFGLIRVRLGTPGGAHLPTSLRQV